MERNIHSDSLAPVPKFELDKVRDQLTEREKSQDRRIHILTWAMGIFVATAAGLLGSNMWTAKTDKESLKLQWDLFHKEALIAQREGLLSIQNVIDTNMSVLILARDKQIEMRFAAQSNSLQVALSGMTAEINALIEKNRDSDAKKFSNQIEHVNLELNRGMGLGFYAQGVGQMQSAQAVSGQTVSFNYVELAKAFNSFANSGVSFAKAEDSAGLRLCLDTVTAILARLLEDRDKVPKNQWDGFNIKPLLDQLITELQKGKTEWASSDLAHLKLFQYRLSAGKEEKKD